jgi:hypothetical protein
MMRKRGYATPEFCDNDSNKAVYRKRVVSGRTYWLEEGRIRDRGLGGMPGIWHHTNFDF